MSKKWNKEHWQGIKQTNGQNEFNYFIPALDENTGINDNFIELLQASSKSRKGLNMSSPKATVKEQKTLYSRYQHYASVINKLANMGDESAIRIYHFSLTLSLEDTTAIFADNADYIRTVLKNDKRRGAQWLDLLYMATIAGSAEICNFLIREYKIHPNADLATKVFLSNNLALVDFFVKTIRVSPRIAFALNYTAITLDVDSLNYLVKTYSGHAQDIDESLLKGTSNFLVTALYHKDEKDRVESYVKAALELGARPNGLALTVALDNGFNDIAVMYVRANPSLLNSHKDRLLNVMNDSEYRAMTKFEPDSSDTAPMPRSPQI